MASTTFDAAYWGRFEHRPRRYLEVARTGDLKLMWKSYQSQPRAEKGRFLAHFDVAEFDLESLHRKLEAHGVAFHTLEPLESGARVIVSGEGQEQLDKVNLSAEYFGVTGTAEFIDTTKKDGTDGEQRYGARRIHERVIVEGVIPEEGGGRQLAERDLGSLWQEIRDRWGERLQTEVKKPAPAERAYDESEHPRDEYGRWTDAGSSKPPAREGEGSGRAQPPSAGEGNSGASADKLTGTYSGRRATDAERSRHVIQVWEPDSDGRAIAEKLGITPQTFEQLNVVTGGADRFHAAIAAAKTGKYAAAVHAYSAAEYSDMDLYLSPDGLTGFALKGKDIVSCFKHPDYRAKGACHSMLALAVQKGGRKLDAFDTVLPELYSKNGFRAASRLAWKDEFAPQGWNKDTYKAFNSGEPDVVFMVYDPQYVNAAPPYSKTDGIRAQDYDDAVRIQQQAMEHAASKPPPPLPRPKPALSDAEINKAIRDVSKDLDFDPAMIDIDHGAPSKFTLNGQQYEAAGLAHTHKIGKAALLVTIYSQKITGDAMLRRVTSHEIEHIKFETAYNRYQADYQKVLKEPNLVSGPDPVMRADGTLKPPYDTKYPAYTAMVDFTTRSIEDFAAADGVSDYSFDWWKNWKANGGRAEDAHSAQHETLAEMARIKYETGKFPEHMGERILSWRIPLGGTVDDAKPKPSQAQMDRNAKLWRDLYRAVDKVWKLPA